MADFTTVSIEQLEAGVGISPTDRAAMIAHCLRDFPHEACGLLVGDFSSGRVTSVVATPNMAASAQLYTVDPKALLRTDREAEADGHSIIGVYHSHTHTDPYPSETDVNQAPDPSWHYVLVSLREEVPTMRSYRIVSSKISEESIRDA